MRGLFDKPALPKVLNRRDNPTDGVYIGRPSKWGNPFVIGRDGTRAEVKVKYLNWIKTQPKLRAEAKVELRGHNLICFCEPRWCHGRVLVRIANED